MATALFTSAPTRCQARSIPFLVLVFGLTVTSASGIQASQSATPITTTTSLVVSPDNNLIAGEPITLKATVTAADGSSLPNGTVKFAVPLGGQVTVPLTSGVGVYVGTIPPAGTYSILAVYDGASGFASSESATVTRTVSAPGLIAQPSAQPALVQTFQPTLVTVQAQVETLSLVAKSVALRKFHTDPETGTRDSDGSVAMYDDGTHGDGTAGDGIYTAQVSVSGNVHAQFLYQVEAQYTSKQGAYGSLSNFTEVIVAPILTAQDYNLMDSTVMTADSKFASFTNGGDTPASAQSKTIAWLAHQPGVSAAGASASENPNIWIVFTSGMNAVLSEADLETTRGGGLSLKSKFGEPRSLSLSGAELFQIEGPSSPVINASVVRESPFHTNPSTGQDEGYDDEAGLISARLQQSTCGYPVTPYVDSQSDLNSFTNLGSSGVVLISGHGDAYFDFNPSHTVIHLPSYASPFWIKPQAVIYTRQIPADADLQRPSYQTAIELGQVVYVYVHELILGVEVPVHQYYGITPDFIRAYYLPELSLHPIVYVGTCESLINDSMASAFVGQGANSYFGYTGIVNTDFAARKGYALFGNLLMGMSTEGALEAVPNNQDKSNSNNNPIYASKYTSLQLYQGSNADAVLPVCEQADFIFDDGEPGNLTITINGVVRNFPSLQFNQTVSLGFAELPAGGTYNLQIQANGGFADYTINLPHGFRFSDGTTSKANHIVSFAGPNSYTFESTSTVETSAKVARRPKRTKSSNRLGSRKRHLCPQPSTPRPQTGLALSPMPMKRQAVDVVNQPRRKAPRIQPIRVIPKVPELVRILCLHPKQVADVIVQPARQVVHRARFRRQQRMPEVHRPTPDPAHRIRMKTFARPKSLAQLQVRQEVLLRNQIVGDASRSLGPAIPRSPVEDPRKVSADDVAVALVRRVVVVDPASLAVHRNLYAVRVSPSADACPIASPAKTRPPRKLSTPS